MNDSKEVFLDFIPDYVELKAFQLCDICKKKRRENKKYSEMHNCIHFIKRTQIWKDKE